MSDFQGNTRCSCESKTTSILCFFSFSFRHVRWAWMVKVSWWKIIDLIAVNMRHVKHWPCFNDSKKQRTKLIVTNLSRILILNKSKTKSKRDLERQTLKKRTRLSIRAYVGGRHRKKVEAIHHRSSTSKCVVRNSLSLYFDKQSQYEFIFRCTEVYIHASDCIFFLINIENDFH